MKGVSNTIKTPLYPVFPALVLQGSVPTKIRVKVTSAQPVLPRTDGTANRHVIVEGGVSVMVPGHIQEGDTIVVNTASAMYDSRAV